MNFKSPEEALNRNIDTNNPTGKLENKLTPEEMKDLVRNLDVTKIQNFEFKNALVDIAPDAQMILGDKNNLKESLLALSDTPRFTPPLTKEQLFKYNQLGPRAILFNQPDWDKIEKNGAVFFPVYFKTYAFSKDDEFVQELYKDFAEQPSPALLADLYEKYKGTQIRGAGDPAILEQLKKRKEETGLVLEEDYSTSVGYLFPLEQQMLTGDQSVDYKRSFDESLFPTVTFDYEGHEFKIFRNPSDNTSDKSLQDHDNPFLLKRFGSWFNLKIDGEQYKEKSYDPNATNLEGSSGIYDGFNSWRKWIGYRDVVVKD